LDLIDFYRKRYGISVGYSGHEADFEPTVVAYAKGAKIIERHITLNKSDVGFDHKLSLNSGEMKELNNRLDYIDQVSGDGLKILRDYELVTRDKYRVSMIAKRDLNIGETLQINDVLWKNPGTGIPRIDLEKYLGRKVLHFIPQDKLIESSDFEPS
jgi:sialic acid synthase SpsE